MTLFRTLIIIVALIVGAGIGWVAKPDSSKENQNNTNSQSNSSNMQDMNMAESQAQSIINSLKVKQGAEFDAAFANAMIEHHTAATAMAEYVDTEAPHSEIKKMAGDIITAQTKEIGDLQTFALAQGYDLQAPDASMISKMTLSLTGKKGPELEKQFMQDMIMHHRNAIEMAKLAQTNASSETIKTMAGDIITAQTKEIGDLQSWAGQWGYKLSS